MMNDRDETQDEDFEIEMVEFSQEEYSEDYSDMEDYEEYESDEYEYADSEEDRNIQEEEVDEDGFIIGPDGEKRLPKKDRILNGFITVFATLILMFFTFGSLKVWSMMNPEEAQIIYVTEKSTETEKASEEETETESTTKWVYNYNPQNNQGGDYETETEIESETETETEQEENSDFKTICETTVLSPCRTGYAKLDSLVGGVVATASGNNYAKLQKIYDYVVNNNAPGSGCMTEEEIFAMLGKEEYASQSDAAMVAYAYSAMTEGSNSPEEYAAEFMVLARWAGFSAVYASGSQSSLGSHSWVMIPFGGTYYIFDPYADDKAGTNKEYFGITVEQSQEAYAVGVINEFQYFKKLSGYEIKVTTDSGETATCVWESSSEMSMCVAQCDMTIQQKAGMHTVFTANSGENLMATWQAYVKDVSKGIEKEVATGNGGTAEYILDWTWNVPGNYELSIVGTDTYGRACKVVFKAEIGEKEAVVALNMEAQKQETAEAEKYIIITSLSNGSEFTCTYEFSYANEKSVYVAIDDAQITDGENGTKILTIPEQLKAGTQIRVVATATDTNNEVYTKEITFITKGLE